MDNDSKIEQAQRDIRAANDTVQLARGDSDTREALHLALSACELMAAVISDQQERIEQLENVLQNHLETTPRRRTSG
jgi:hypothetical protein